MSKHFILKLLKRGHLKIANGKKKNRQNIFSLLDPVTYFIYECLFTIIIRQR